MIISKSKSLQRFSFFNSLLEHQPLLLNLQPNPIYYLNFYYERLKFQQITR
jgi:hypothetical protein